VGAQFPDRLRAGFSAPAPNSIRSLPEADLLPASDVVLSDVGQFVADPHVVLLRRPINTGVVAHLYFSSVRITRQRPDLEVPLRTLIDGPSTRGYVLLPLAAAHHRPRDWSAFGPAPGEQSWPSPGGGRGNNRTPHEQSRERGVSCVPMTARRAGSGPIVSSSGPARPAPATAGCRSHRRIAARYVPDAVC
jgi:hypothetical protein